MAKTLNLDTLHGRQPDDIVVRVGGVDHRLRHPDEFGPLELAKFERAQKMYAVLAMANDNLEEGETQALSTLAEGMDKTLDALIGIVCPELLTLSFRQKLEVLAFYVDQVKPDDSADSKKAGAPTEEQTGETSTPA